MSDTPRTDAIVQATQVNGWATACVRMTQFARELERENARLRSLGQSLRDECEFLHWLVCDDRATSDQERELPKAIKAWDETNPK